MGKNQKGKRHIMNQHLNNRDRDHSRFLTHLAVEKKKAAVALGLIAVMVLMWVRVIGRRTADGAQAALVQGKDRPVAAAPDESKWCFVDLPQVEGRNDALTRDFFASNAWQAFAKNREGEVSIAKEVSVMSQGVSEEVVRRVAAHLKLQAIWSAENPQAFINDKLLSVGDKLVVREGVNTFECEVVEIEENKVAIRFEEARITLKLAQTKEVSD